MPSNDFSLRALFNALDAQRQARGLSWSQVIKEMHQRSDRPSTRRLSQSTVSGIGTRSAAEGDGILAMLRWLNRTAESFVPGHRDSKEISSWRPDIPPGMFLRFDAKKIYAALDARRLEREMTWAEVAKEIGTNSASLTHLAQGKRVGFPGIMRILKWLDRPAADFTRATDI